MCFEKLVILSFTASLPPPPGLLRFLKSSHSLQRRLHGISEQQTEISLNTRSAYNVLQDNG